MPIVEGDTHALLDESGRLLGTGAKIACEGEQAMRRDEVTHVVEIEFHDDGSESYTLPTNGRT